MFLTALLAVFPLIYSAQDLNQALPFTQESIEAFSETSQRDYEEGMERLLALYPEERTFDNTIRAWDALYGNFFEAKCCLTGIMRIHPEKTVRDCAEREIKKLERISADSLLQHPELFPLCSQALEKDPPQTRSGVEYAKHILIQFRREGLALSAPERQEFSEVKQQVSDLMRLFHRNLSEASEVLKVSAEDLGGMTADWLARYPRDQEGRYVLNVDLPTSTAVLERCTSQKTRKAMAEMFFNRGYPKNEQVIQELCAKRERLAQLLGYSSFAAYDLEIQMAQTPERVKGFLDQLQEVIAPFAAREYAQIVAQLPDSVQLCSSGQIEKHDQLFAFNAYKERYFSLDTNKIAEYFPLEKVIGGLIEIYEQFFSLSIQKAEHSLPIPEIQALEVRERSGKLLGIILIDLFPREGKYAHIGNCTAFSFPKSTQEGTDYPSVCVVIANFAKPAVGSSCLMKHSDVVMFFHEFGHAIHHTLARNEFLSFSGLQMKTVDFVETPSQLLERWMWDRAILKQISSHHITHEPLSDEQIAMMQEAARFGEGFIMQRQCCLARLSLAFHSEMGDQTPTQLMHEVVQKEIPFVVYADTDHFHNSWIHIPNYGAKYYSYLWSKAYVWDLFAKIEKEGLLNPATGKAYADAILKKGGSCPPEEMMAEFLGRPPSLEPFFSRWESKGEGASGS